MTVLSANWSTLILVEELSTLLLETKSDDIIVGKTASISYSWVIEAPVGWYSCVSSIEPLSPIEISELSDL